MHASSTLPASPQTPPPFTLRRATADDRDDLLRIYASSRDEELAIVPWTPAEKNAFLRMQFRARENDYTARFSDRGHAVIERDGASVGYIWVHHGPEEIRILDVALLPEERGRGIGTALLEELIGEARSRKLAVRLSVLSNSPARRLYERLGFQTCGAGPVYLQMELRP